MALVTGLSPNKVVEAGVARYYGRLPRHLKESVGQIADARRRASAHAAVSAFLAR